MSDQINDDASCLAPEASPARPRVFIMTDSASDITQDEGRDLGIRIVPLTTTFPDGTYRDGVDIDAPTFYKKIAATDAIPVTSQPAPTEFCDAFREALRQADEVVCVTISAGLSGTFQSACIARADLPKDDQARVHIVDSLTCSVAEGLLVRIAVQMRDQGASSGDIVDSMETLRDKVHIVALVDTLEFLRKGGRIPTALAVAGTMLSIHPVIATVDGKVGLLGQARGPKKGQNLLSKVIYERNGVDFSRPFRLAYSGGGHELLMHYWNENDDLHAEWNQEPPISMLGPVIGTHAGPGCIAVAFFEKG